MAYDKDSARSSPSFCIVSQQAMRVQRQPRTSEEATAAVKLFSDAGLLDALEDMIKVARSGKIESAAALAARAAPW